MNKIRIIMNIIFTICFLATSTSLIFIAIADLETLPKIIGILMLTIDYIIIGIGILVNNYGEN